MPDLPHLRHSPRMRRVLFLAIFTLCVGSVVCKAEPGDDLVFRRSVAAATGARAGPAGSRLASRKFVGDGARATGLPSQKLENLMSRIAYGNVAKDGQFPFAVRVSTDDSVCSGSLIRYGNSTSSIVHALPSALYHSSHLSTHKCKFRINAVLAWLLLPHIASQTTAS